MTIHPVITNDVQMTEYLLGLDEKIDAELLIESFCRVGRNSSPELLATLHLRDRLLDLDVLAVGIESAWTGAEFPTRMLDVDAWADMFETVGYLVDDKRRPDLLPTEPIRLYRGALPGSAYGWSWTSDQEKAQWFADRFPHLGPSRVWTAKVAPHRLYAHFESSRNESEYVVDTTAMGIEVWS